MTPLFAWIGLGLVTAGFWNYYFQTLAGHRPRAVRLKIWAATILGCVLIWPVPFGIGALAVNIPMVNFWRRHFGWSLLPPLRE
jgi:hypothetical protein